MLQERLKQFVSKAREKPAFMSYLRMTGYSIIFLVFGYFGVSTIDIVNFLLLMSIFYEVLDIKYKIPIKQEARE